MQRYDTTKSRFTVHGKSRAFETLNPHEVQFWRTLGYQVQEFRWNGKIFV